MPANYVACSKASDGTVPNGSDVPGTVLDDCSIEFRERFAAADLIIAKDQGNYASLDDTDRPIGFLLRVKCELVARNLGCMVRSSVVHAPFTGLATVTVVPFILDDEGSIAVDATLLARADILPGEQVHVLNVNTGARLITYAIAAPAGSGTILLNGPAARLGEPGDLVVVLTYALVPTAQAKRLKPVVVHVDGRNRPIAKRSANKG